MNASRARTSRSPVAHDFTWPLTVPGGEIAGAEVVRELPPEVALTVWQALRSVLLWAGQPEDARAGLFEPDAMRAWEAELLRGPLEAPLRDPLAVIVDELATPGEASEPDLSWACMCVAEWCLGRGAVSTALAFAEACALCWPEHARYAWFAGRLLRRHGRLKEAEQWIRRAIRIAVSTGDPDTQTLGMNSLGNVLHQQGRYDASRRTLRNALRLARRFRLPEREGEVLHDLLVASHAVGDFARAEEYARGALQFYQTGHARLPALAHDVAWLWIELQQYSRALTLLRELRPFFPEPGERMQILGSTARAAGACGDRTLFLALWDDFEKLAAGNEHAEGFPTASIHFGHGAYHLSEHEIAKRALERGLQFARDRGEFDAVVRAEELLKQVADVRPAVTHRPRRGTAATEQRDPLAAAFVSSLRECASSASG